MRPQLTFILLAAISLGAAVAIVSCDDNDAADSSSANPAAGAELLPADFVLASAPEDPIDVAALRASAKDGDQVVVQGWVGGREEPIASDRAIFTLLDSSIASCDKTPMDTCPTPWDGCCEPADVIAANSAAIQVVDDTGRPLKAGLGGIGGLAPLKRVMVVGTYRPSADGKAATVDAQKIYVVP